MPALARHEAQPADVQGTPFMPPGKACRRDAFASWLEQRDGLSRLDSRPIFAVGEHNGKPYTKADLAAIVAAYQPLLDQIRPRIKVGHDDAQAYARKRFASFGTDPNEKSLGLPALGFIANLRLNDAYTDRRGRPVEAGTQIIADFVNMPRDVAEAVTNLEYPDVSAEIIRGYRDKREPDKTWPLVLKAVALLGDELPAVRTLGPLVEHNTSEGDQIEIITFSQGDFSMPENIAPAGQSSTMADVVALLKQLLELQKKDIALETGKAEPDGDELAARGQMSAQKAEEDMKAKQMAEERPAVPSVPAVPEKEEKNAERFAQIERELHEQRKITSRAMAEIAAAKAREAEAVAKSEAEKFAESVSSPANYRLPADLRADLVRLYARAPETEKFSDGSGSAKSYREQFADFVGRLPLIARPEAFQDRALALKSSQSGTLADRVEKMADDIIKAEPGLTRHAAFLKAHRSLSAQDYLQISPAAQTAQGGF